MGKIYAEFNGTAADTWIAVEESVYDAKNCVILSGSHMIFLSVADARALIDGLMAFTEGSA